LFFCFDFRVLFCFPPCFFALFVIAAAGRSQTQKPINLLNPHSPSSSPIKHTPPSTNTKTPQTQGDLDAATTTRHLVPLKAAYLKLRYLADAGCVFVGHGLKADFRMTGLSVAPAQVRDTVELFCPTPGHRRLRLRFLASYLLGLSIQGSEGAFGAGAAAALGAGAGAGALGALGAGAAAAASLAAAGHDSVEDARTALKLYREWQRLRDAGQLEAKIEEMYAWGKAHGWDSGPAVPAAAAAAAARPA
jgi:hypothetical protein